MTDFVEGNFEDKYNSKNPISKLLMSNFLDSIDKLLNEIDLKNIKSVVEVGVGEGELLKNISNKIPKAKFWATDLSENEIEKAKNYIKFKKVGFSVQNAENLSKFKDKQFDLVICCEVLGHVEDFQKALKELYRISNKYLLVSVPNEPIWRMLNMARGKYLSDFGNTPGHINHWSISAFKKLIKSSDFIILDKKYPFPWQMMLLRVN